MKNNIEKKNTNKIKKQIKKIIIIILIIIAIAYSAYAIITLLINPNEIVTVENGKISAEESCVGYIIRDESVLKGDNYKNGIVQIKTEGEKIAKSEVIFRYYTKEEEHLKSKIKELDEKISLAQSQENNIFSNDIKLIEEEIENKLSEINKLNDIQKIEEKKNEINKLVQKKTKIIGEKSPSGSYLKQLIEERSSYENKLNSGSEYIKTDKSGIVSYKVDGLEETLNIDKLDTITAKFLEELNLKTGQIISSSNECGKIVNNYECYIATIIEEEKILDLKEGSSLKIRLSNGDETEATVKAIKEDENKKKILILRINKKVEELIEYRKINFNIILWSYSGLKVPNTAIIQKENLSYVIRNKAGYQDEILVKIEKQNENYAIVGDYDTDELKQIGLSSNEIRNNKNISLYDEIVAKPKEEEK